MPAPATNTAGATPADGLPLFRAQTGPPPRLPAPGKKGTFMQFTLVENAAIARGVFRMTLKGDCRSITRPGQFVQIQVPGFYLRRPLSVYDWEAAQDGWVTVVYKVVGHGTDAMSTLASDMPIDLLTGLGNGYDMDSCTGDAPLLLGGGVGVPPLYGLCKRLLAQGKHPTAVLGFNTKDEIILRQDFEALGVPTVIATVDGSEGHKGFVTDAAGTLAGPFDYVYTCGPEPMLKAVYRFCETHGLDGQFSFEERMGCGFGACMGCTCKTKYGNKRICKDGPVLFREEIIW